MIVQSRKSPGKQPRPPGRFGPSAATSCHLTINMRLVTSPLAHTPCGLRRSAELSHYMHNVGELRWLDRVQAWKSMAPGRDPIHSTFIPCTILLSKVHE